MATKRKKRPDLKPASHALRWAAFALGLISPAAFAAYWGSRWLSGKEVPALAELGLWEWMILGGGPVATLAFTLFAFKSEKLAGGLLWLGGAAAAMGFGIRAGYHLAEYFQGFLFVVLPEIAAGTLFLLHARGITSRT